MANDNESFESGINPRFNPFSWFIGEPKVGEGTWIGPFTVIDGSGSLSIGSNCDISSGVQIYTHSSVRRCVSSRNFTEVERLPTSIGDNVFIGANCVVLMGSTIGDSAVVAAGSVVKGDIPPFKIYAGIPAVEIGCVVITEEGVLFNYDL